MFAVYFIAVNIFSLLSSPELDCYLSSHDFYCLLRQTSIKRKPKSSSINNLFNAQKTKIYCGLFSPLRKLHNFRFLHRELSRRRNFFDTVAKFPLGDSQRRAVIINEDNNLVIAGAGSGKTFTIVAKIKYLTSIIGVDPRQILAISFTRKSANELQERIANPGVKSSTFHAFGLEILRSLGGNHPQILTSDSALELLNRFLVNQLKSLRYLQKFQLFGLDNITFLELTSAFLVLFKSSGQDFNQLSSKISKLKSRKFQQYANLFLELFRPLFFDYQHFLESSQLIDFTDMIVRSVDALKNNQVKLNYRYVIVDEFQDISFDRYLLLMALRCQQPALKFFCVGDDWQSIYRFAGSDNGLFTYFSDYFGKTAISRIETTYRFGPPLLNFSSAFILQNPAQVKKRLKSFGRHTALHCLYSDCRNDDTLALRVAFEQLIARGISLNDTILILGRYGFDFDRIKNSQQFFQIDRKNCTLIYHKDGTAYQANFLTVHKSKGLEADHVIVLNCNTGAYGFPADRSDDPILGLLLSAPESFPFSEERRLFYVAITRARKSATLIAERAHPSDFFLTALRSKFRAS